MSIRSRLVLLVMAVLVPAALAAVWGIDLVARAERATFEQSFRETTRALALAVDRELMQRETLVKTLAGSPTLTRGDLAAFYEYARSVAPTADTAIVLSDANGQQLLNTRLPFGSVLPPVIPQALRNPPRPEATVVSDLYLAPIAQQHSFAVQVPVMREGKLLYYLAVGSYAAQLQKVLTEQHLPQRWLAAILDRNGTVAARTSRPEQFVGKPATEHLRKQAQLHDDAVFETTGLDGEPVLASFSKSPRFGWIVAMGVPLDVVGKGVQDAVAVLIGSALALLGLAVLAAFWVGRTIVLPVQQLAQTAQALGRGERIVPASSGLRETDVVNQALARASEQIRNANAVLERRVAEAVAQSERAQQAALQSQKLEALGRLTGGIAHDFNNLLQTLSTGLQVADRLAQDPRAHTAIQSCKRAVARAVKLTRQLMSFGRSQPVQQTTLDLRAALAEISELLIGALPVDIPLRIDCADNAWPVHVDRVQLELALLNLTLNARDAMPGGGMVAITVANQSRSDGYLPAELLPGDYVAVTVRDTGEGIAPEIVTRVFEPFFTTKEAGRGSGIGLAQVYGFAKQSRGAVSIDSVVGQGTSVTIWLPRAHAAADAPISAAVEPDGARGCSASVLLVEDDGLVRDAVASALEAFGFQVIVASDADEALRTLEMRAGEIDIVFSDIVMPGTRSGVELAAEIAQRLPGMPVVLATGYSERLPADRSLPVIAKPYEIHALADMLCDIVERNRGRLDARRLSEERVQPCQTRS